MLQTQHDAPKHGELVYLTSQRLLPDMEDAHVPPTSCRSTALPVQAHGGAWALKVRSLMFFFLVLASITQAHPALAATISRGFNVTVNLLNPSNPLAPPKNSAFCKKTDVPGSFGATVTVVCKTGAVVDISSDKFGAPWRPTHGGAYRYLLEPSLNGTRLGLIDAYTSTGTYTSWRVVNLAPEKDYLEMLINW